MVQNVLQYFLYVQSYSANNIKDAIFSTTCIPPFPHPLAMDVFDTCSKCHYSYSKIKQDIFVKKIKVNKWVFDKLLR